jgi:hypothetical protein
MLYFMPKNTLLVDDDMRNILRYQNFTRTWISDQVRKR